MHTRKVPLTTFHLLWISHIRNSVRPTFHFLRIFHIRRLMLEGKGGRFNFPGQTYPDPLIALTQRASGADNSDYQEPFCTVPRCSPEASRYLPPTKLDFFSQDILCKFLFSPCNQSKILLGYFLENIFSIYNFEPM